MSSLFGALETAVSGLTAQSSAFGNISDNVANSQTTGFKRIDTNFVDYLTTSTAVTNDSGFVTGRPEYRNSVQGTIATSDNPLAIAISGNGFFQVAKETQAPNGTATVSPKTEYSRNGNFTLDKSGYLLNGSGEVLNGWLADPVSGVVSQNQVLPIKIAQGSFSPVPTSQVTLSANLPATPAAAGPVASQINVYDAKGALHTVSLSWTQNAADSWTVAVSSPDAATPAIGGADVKFGNASGNGVPAGTIGSLGATTGTVSATSYSAGAEADLTFTADFGSGPQSVKVDLGGFGQANGVTQFAGNNYNLRGLSQNGIPPGAFSSISLQANGDVNVNYDNGQSRVVAQIPIIKFNAPDELQREDGQAFSATQASGVALAQQAGLGGAGAIVTNATEGSNVDIATEFTKLIVAQRAYSANTKMITTAEEMLQQTIDMKR